MKSAKAKSYFILPALAVSALLCLLGLVKALGGGPERLAWWGVAFSAVPLPVIIARLATTRAARASENAPLGLLVAAAGTLLAAWEWLMEQVAGWEPFAAACTALALLLLYVYWYARFGRFETPRLAVGNKLPDFTVTDLDGASVDSEEFRGRPTVVLFYRGNWCALCMGQVAELAARSEDFTKLGVDVILISPQDAERTRELASRYEVPYRFLVDRDNQAAAELDIAVGHGVPAGLARGYHPDTVMPTVVVTNANGTILFSDQTDNYRVRPEPDIFLAILRRTGAIAG